MTTQYVETLAVGGTVRRRGGSTVLVLDERLDGNDVRLANELVLSPDGVTLRVRVKAFDDFTTAQPMEPERMPSLADGEEWRGHLRLGHGLDTP